MPLSICFCTTCAIGLAHRGVELGLARAGIFLLGKQEFDHLGGARQAAGMGRENPVGAALHMASISTSPGPLGPVPWAKTDADHGDFPGGPQAKQVAGLRKGTAFPQAADIRQTADERLGCADSRPSAYPYRRRQSTPFSARRRGQRPTVAPAGYATRDLPLLKSLKTATVAPTSLAIWRMSDKTVLGKVHSMELGIYHEFPVLPGRSQAECFAAGFDIVDAGEEYGLDVIWLAEIHFDKRRCLAASPLILGTAIAARTERIKIGTSVQVIPLANPLRIAEESAILDHVSKGRLIFGVGRSGVVKTYEAMNIAYSESKDREIECLEIIQRAWQEDNFSYKGKFYDIQDVTVVPHPVQTPTPEIRLAAASVETFPAAGKAGQGLFLSARHEDVRVFKPHIDVYRKAWTDAGISRRGTRLSPLPRFCRQNRCGGPGGLRAHPDAAFPEPKPPAFRLCSATKQPAGPPALQNRAAPSRNYVRGSFARFGIYRLARYGGGEVERPATRHRAVRRAIGNELRRLADHAAEREAIRLLAREVKSAFH